MNADIRQRYRAEERNKFYIIVQYAHYDIIYDLSWYGNANQIQNAIKHIITAVLSEYWKEIMGHPYIFKICQ